MVRTLAYPEIPAFKGNLTYMGGTQLQHLHNGYSCEHQFLCDCSSAEKTPSQSIPRYPEILDQSLVQTQPERLVCLLEKAKIAITASPTLRMCKRYNVLPPHPCRLFLVNVIASHPGLYSPDGWLHTRAGFLNLCTFIQ